MEGAPPLILFYLAEGENGNIIMEKKKDTGNHQSESLSGLTVGPG